ncbi:MAG TPA: tetratricopeptide repeat protein [candidate division Zixibacteria bacterium]|nr:tetratricopeptide repeat protein [candidate division Zixibacteria bacterium]
MKSVLTFCLAGLLVAGQAKAVEMQRKGVNLSLDKHSADSLLDIADEFFQANEIDSALGQYERARQRAVEESDSSVEVEALSQIARMNLILGNRDEGMAALDRAASMAKDSEPMGWSRYLGVKGRFEWKENDLDSARKTFDEQYTYCVVNSLDGRAVDAAHMMAIVSETLDEQVRWSQMGIEAAEKAGQERWLGPLWNNLGGIYYDNKMFDSSLNCYRKAREYHWRYSTETAKLFADYHIGMVLGAMGRFEEAQTWLRPVLAWAERLDNHSAIAQACEDLGEIEVLNGRKPEGLTYLRRARDEFQKAGYESSMPDIWIHINQRIADLEK